MKSALQLCSLALNPAAPSPTAAMVKIEGGEMVSFGGTFCVRVPVPVEVGACFNPSVVAPFFRKPRKVVTYTLKKNRLWIQEGSEKLSVPFLPPEELVTLDVLSTPVPVEFDLGILKPLADAIDPAHRMLCAQGVTFRYGMAEAMNSCVAVSCITDLPEDFEFNVPVDSVKALLKFKPKLSAIAASQHAVKFVFDDGSSLTTRVIADLLIDTSKLYAGEWKPIKLKDAVDILKIDCETIRFEDGSMHYIREDAEGVVDKVVDKSIKCHVKKDHFDTLLKVSSDIRISDDNNRVMAFGDDTRALMSVLRS